MAVQTREEHTPRPRGGRDAARPREERSRHGWGRVRRDGAGRRQGRTLRAGMHLEYL